MPRPARANGALPDMQGDRAYSRTRLLATLALDDGATAGR